MISSEPNYIFKRSIRGFVEKEPIYQADSTVTIYKKDLGKAFQANELALGQLYSKIGLAPKFQLTSVGRNTESKLTRSYRFYIDDCIESVIDEVFFHDFRE